MSEDTRPFPIQGDSGLGGGGRSFIPWWLAEIAYRQYSKNFGKDQSLETFAERGGFGRQELIMLLNGLNIVSGDPICLCPTDGTYPRCAVHRNQGALR